MSVQNVSFPFPGYVQKQSYSQPQMPKAGASSPSTDIRLSLQINPHYTDEEKVVLTKDPNADLIVYNANNGNYGRMLDNMNLFTEQRQLVAKYITNPSFKNMMENKFFKGNSDRITQLVNVIYKLGQDSEDIRKEVNTPGYLCPYLPDTKRLYASIDVNNCIKNVDKLFSSKVSDDLKEYMLYSGDKLTDLWYVDTTLKYLKVDNISAKDLTLRCGML